MADPAPASLMGIPLEVRHMIFAEASVRDVKAKNVLRQWFERRDVKTKIAKIVADNPTGPTPKGAYHGDENESDSEDENQDEDEGEDEDEEDNEDDDEDGDDIEDDEDEDEQGEHMDVETEDNELEAEDEDMDIANGATQAIATAATSADNMADAVMDNGEVENDEVVEGVDDQAIDGEGQEADEDIAPDAANMVPAPSAAPIVQADRKWRHISKFLRITQSPPPVELFLLNKELSRETKAWFYNTAILKVEATGSFAHSTFFELALTQLAEAAFSPMENIKKAEVTIVWDTTWVRNEAKTNTQSSVVHIFDFLLQERIDFVMSILEQAPELEQVVVHWHDTEEDDSSQRFMSDICEKFLGLKASIKVEQHLIASDVKPRRNSIAGKRRIEFQNIIDSKLEAF